MKKILYIDIGNARQQPANETRMAEDRIQVLEKLNKGFDRNDFILIPIYSNDSTRLEQMYEERSLVGAIRSCAEDCKEEIETKE